MRPLPARRPSGKLTVAAMGVAALVGAAMLGTGTSAVAAPGGTTPTLSAATSQPTQNVIVVLRDQHADLKIAKGTAASASARVRANHGDQAGLIASIKAAGGKNVRGYTAFNGVAATVTATQAAQLADDPAVASVFPDLTLRESPNTPDSDRATSKAASKAATKAAPRKAATTAATTAPTAAPAAGVSSSPQSGQVCPSDPSQPLLEPEALGVTNTAFSNAATPQAQTIVDGTGVKVAFIADGIDINNPDFIRANGTHVFTDYQDFSGEGPDAPSGAAEAFGDASSIAAQGRQVYDLADYVNANHPLPPGCNITVRGVAPGATLVGLKVFGNANTAPTSRFIEAIDYAISSGVDVLNESFGGNPFPDTANDPITLADDAAVDAGVTVVASTGDAGTTGTVGSPASSGNIIGVGATTTYQSYAQETGGGFQLSPNGTWISNNISSISSGGFTSRGGVPDLVAPGDLGWALCSPDTATYEECTDDNGNPAAIQNFGGTSQASPLTAGAAALVIEAYENTHHGVRPSPALVKRFITSTANDLGTPAYEQGSGLLNSLGAVQAAESWRDANGTPTPVGGQLVLSKTQVSFSGTPSSSQSTTVSVTNAGDTTQVVQPTTRSFEKVVGAVSGTGSINAATSPSYVDAFGVTRSYASFTFTVGSVDRLDVSEAAAVPAGFATRIILIDPTGAFTAYSIPQGAANYGHVDVRAPKAGTWTGYFALSKSSGYNGTFAWSAVQTDYDTHGTVTPKRITLAPGASGTFKVSAKMPTTPRDLSASVEFSGGGGVVTSMPLTLRAAVPAKATSFSGTLTGGNGRGAPAQSNFYYLNVPSGKKDLSLHLKFAQDPSDTVFALLTAPDGQTISERSNLQDGSIQMYLRNPRAGRWTLSLDFVDPVSGLEISQKFTATVAYNTVNIKGTFPNNAATVLPSGVAKTVPVTIKNTSGSTLNYFADPRLTATGSIDLSELTGNATTPLPVPAGVTPAWLVPSHVTSLNATAVADQPVNLDFFAQFGNPDIYASANGNGASVTESALQVTPGIWAADIGQTGPFSSAAPPGTVTASVTATGQLFDPAVQTDAGDFWEYGVTTPTQAVDGTPLTLSPGQTGTIMVTITPNAPTGSVVKGQLYIGTVDGQIDGGDELIAFPYTYKVG